MLNIKTIYYKGYDKLNVTYKIKRKIKLFLCCLHLYKNMCGHIVKWWSIQKGKRNNINGTKLEHCEFSLFTIAKIWRQPKCPPWRRWVGETTVHLYNEVLLGCKKGKFSPLPTARMDPENIMPSEMSQSEKDRGHMISLICGI